MARPCSVCCHEQRLEIERLVRAGIVLAEIPSALEIEIPGRQLWVHKTEHMGIIRRRGNSALSIRRQNRQAFEMRPFRLSNVDLAEEWAALVLRGHKRRHERRGLATPLERAAFPGADWVALWTPWLAEAMFADGDVPTGQRLHPAEWIRAKQRGRRWLNRMLLLHAYGHSCACCGEGKEPFLALDHVDGGGSSHRRFLTSKGTSAKGGAGDRVYRDVISRGYPKDRFQLLCHNCNFAKERRGGCPHSTRPAAVAS